MTMFFAGDLARAWLTVAIASAKDPDRPVLNRTVLIESFSEGVRLVATDSMVMFRAWVPNVDHERMPEPGLEESPRSSVVVIDGHGRGKSLLAYARGLADSADRNDEPAVELRLDLGLIDAILDEDDRVLAGLDARIVTLEVPGRERLKLRTYEGEYVAWRPVYAGFDPEPASVIGLRPDMVDQLAKIGKHYGAMLAFEPGRGGTTAVRPAGAWPPVNGLVMAGYTSFGLDEPADEPDDHDDDDEAEIDGGRPKLTLVDDADEATE
jgi:hypothetical protein